MAIHDYPYSSLELAAQKLAQALSERLSECIENKNKAHLAVSGGSTPIAFFKALANIDIQWEKVVITLVDERWVDEDDSASNAALVRTHLLQNHAAKAGFVPLKTSAADIDEGYMEAENRLHEQLTTLDFAVLGMGDDGHTASWFPNSENLNECLDADNHAWSSVVKDAPNHPHRLTLNWRLLSRCERFFLHFSGQEKYAVYEKALEDVDETKLMPVRKILQQNQVPVSLYRSE